MKHLRIMNFRLFFRSGLLASLLLITLGTPWAQDAGALLSRLSEEAKGYGSIEATYTSTLVDRSSDFKAEQNGTIRIDGDRFHLELGDYTVISDGTTVWTYEVAVNDCYVEDAETIVEDGMDPSKLFTIWEDDFKNEWKGESMILGKKVSQINLYPTGEKEKPFHTIQLYIDEVNLRLVRAVVKGREGTDVTYDVQSFKSQVTIDPSAFTFDAAKYPGASIIDNRL
jgi:outer membrane lipoprotein-sorting protein